MTTQEQLEELKAQLEIEKAKLKALQDQINPPPRPQYDPPPRDYTAGMSMPKSAMQAMIDAVPASVMADIRGDARRPNPVQASSSPLTSSSSAHEPQPQRKGGWVEPRPLESPPGLKYVDAQVDAQDAKDRAELALKLAKAAAIEQAAKKQASGPTDDDAA
jgi:hypothetical protein